MNIKSKRIIFWSKASFLFSAFLCLLYLIAVVFKIEKLPIFEFNIYMLSTIPLAFLCFSMIFFLRIKSNVINVNNFYLKTISISITLILFSLVYPSIPSINEKENNAYETLKEKLLMKHETASLMISNDSYQSFSAYLVNGNQKEGAMNFKLGGNLAVQRNLSIFDTGGYSFIDLMYQITVGDKQYMNNEAREKEITRQSINVNNQPPYDLTENNYVYKDIGPDYFSDKATKLLVDYEIGALDKDKCFNLSSEIFYKDGTHNEKMEKVCAFADRRNSLKIERFLYNKNREIEKVRFMISPSNNGLKDEKTWRVLDAEFRVDNTGTAKSPSSICIEGYLDGNPQKIFHISNNRVLNGSCSYDSSY